MLERGQVIDRYTVDAVLGQGGMAVVYRVRHNQLGSFHALKVLTLTSPGVRERLLQEGRVQANLRHPNIVPVTDVIDVNGQPGLVIEYVDGPSLDVWLQTHQPTLDESEALFRGIVEGVAAAHAQGLVHRDLKPANVMLAPASGGLGVPKVADFGLAKAIVADDPAAHATRSGTTLGTPMYMAPEQIRDAKKVDHRADIFSLGCILYELVCGKPPFSGPDILSIYNAVASGAFAPPDSLVPDLPPRIRATILGALVVDREQRLQDCAALLAVLDGDGPKGGFQPRRPDTLGNATFDIGVIAAPPRRRWGFYVGGALVALLGLGLGVALAGLLVVRAGALKWEEALRADVIERTAGEVTWGSARLRPSGLILVDVKVLGSDGAPVLEAGRMKLAGRWRLRGGVSLAVEDVGVDGAMVYARRVDGAWVLPAHASAGVASWVGENAIERVRLGPISVEAVGDTGALEGFVGGMTLEGPRWEDGAWRLDAMSTGAVHLAFGDPVLQVTAVLWEDDVLRVEKPELYVRIRPDGLIDFPPTVGEAFPHWMGGRDRRHGEATWFGWGDTTLPLGLERVEIAGGALSVYDRAHAQTAQQWKVALDHVRFGPHSAPWMPVAMSGTLRTAQVALEGDLRADGLLRGRLTLRHLPLARLAPYMDASLRRYGVEPTDGSVSATLEFSVKSAALAAEVTGEATDVAFMPVPRPSSAPPLPASATRLAEPQASVPLATKLSGSLADPDFKPVDHLVLALADAVLAPAGGVPELRRVAVAPMPRPTTVPDGTPILRPEPSPTPKTPDAPDAPEETRPDNEGAEGAVRFFERLKREVEEALGEPRRPRPDGGPRR